MPKHPRTKQLDTLLECHFSKDRLSTYLHKCENDLSTALDLYEWNTAVAGAFWETLGNCEIAFRNTLDSCLTARHSHQKRAQTWLEDPTRDLTPRARVEIGKAKERVKQKGKELRHGQIIAELSFGFWRFFLSRTYQTTLWPDLASAFPYAPNRRLQTLEVPIHRLYTLRNRIAHHERLWSEPLQDRYQDLLQILGYIDPKLKNWVAETSRVPTVLAQRPSFDQGPERP